MLVQAYIVKGTEPQGSITVRMWSTKTYDKVVATSPIKSNFTTGRDIKDDSKDCEPTSPVQGFDVRYQRLFYQDGSVVRPGELQLALCTDRRVICEKPKVVESQRRHGVPHRAGAR